MKRLKRYTLLLLVLAAIFYSACQKENYGENGEDDTSNIATIELSQQAIYADVATHSYSVQIVADCSWVAESDSEWLVVESISGDAAIGELMFNVMLNEDNAERIGVITVQNSELEVAAKLSIIQRVATPELDVDNSSSLVYNYKGEIKTISVAANFDYQVESSADWVTWEKTTSEVKIKAAANSTYESRSAEIRIYSKAYNFEGVTVTITQDACECHIGDIMTINNVEGVVYYIGNNKISLVALKEPSAPQKWSTDYTATSANDWYNGANNMAIIKKLSQWTSKYPAFKWCSDCGADWYMPAYYELQELYNQRALVDELLLARGLNPLGEWIWSSTQANHSYAYLQHFSNGEWRYFFKDEANEVRAIYSF